MGVILGIYHLEHRSSEMFAKIVEKQEKHYPQTYQVTFSDPTENTSHLDGEYTLPKARDICMTRQNTKCKLYDEQGFYKGYVDYDGSFFLN